MKKMLAILLLSGLTFCTACGKNPDIRPPNDSLMQESTFTIADGKVTAKTLNSVSADHKTYYTYTLSDAAESTKDASSGAASTLTFAQPQAALDCPAAYTAHPGLAFAWPYESGAFHPNEQWYAIGDTAPGEYEWFFVYSVSKNTLTPLTGTYSGSRSLGVLSLNNIDNYGNITDGTDQGKWCYAFLDQ